MNFHIFNIWTAVCVVYMQVIIVRVFFLLVRSDSAFSFPDHFYSVKINSDVSSYGNLFEAEDKLVHPDNVKGLKLKIWF